jgi:hypothetical protein
VSNLIEIAPDLIQSGNCAAQGFGINGWTALSARPWSAETAGPKKAREAQANLASSFFDSCSLVWQQTNEDSAFTTLPPFAAATLVKLRLLIVVCRHGRTTNDANGTERLAPEGAETGRVSACRSRHRGRMQRRGIPPPCQVERRQMALSHFVCARGLSAHNLLSDLSAEFMHARNRTIVDSASEFTIRRRNDPGLNDNEKQSTTLEVRNGERAALDHFCHGCIL